MFERCVVFLDYDVEWWMAFKAKQQCPFCCYMLYVHIYLAFICHIDSGKATGAQTLELLPQRLGYFGLALLRLAPQVLLQMLAVQRPQRVAGACRRARQTLGVDKTPVPIGKDCRATGSPCQPVLLLLALVLRADLYIVIIIFPIVLKISQVVLGGGEDAQCRSPVQDHHLLTVV